MTPHPPSQPPFWLWPNLLSLDAPVIAVVWQDFLARCYPTTLLPTGRAVLALTVWAIYLADRLLDVRQPASTADSFRHAFYRHHRAVAQSLFVIVVAMDLLLTRFWLRPAVLNNGLFVTGGVVVYLGAFPLAQWDSVAWKKPLAAFLFTSGIFLIAWTGLAHPATQLLWPAGAFCVLCLCNLLMIERWERGEQPARAWLWLLVFCGSAFSTRVSPWFGAAACSAIALGAVSRWGRNLSVDARSVLADAALLSPLLFR